MYKDNIPVRVNETATVRVGTRVKARASRIGVMLLHVEVKLGFVKDEARTRFRSEPYRGTL